MAKQEAVADSVPDGLVRVEDVAAMVAAGIKDEVARQTQDITATILAQLAATNATAPDSSLKATMDMLSMSLAQLTDQGTGKKRIAPEVIVAREKAHDRMVVLINEISARGGKPLYQLRGKVLLDEVLVDPQYIDQFHRAQPQQIIWPGIPNEAMDPLNEDAKAIYAEYREWIGGGSPRDLGVAKVTARGLVVMQRGPAVFKDDMGEALGPEAQHVGVPGSSGTGGLQIPGRGQAGQYVEKRVLGTVAEPARQQA